MQFRAVLVLVFGMLCASLCAQSPVLYFSDIVSGPRSGNSDISGGRPGVHGAIVTIWGRNLGAGPPDGAVFCNGVEAASYYYWGNADAPADLFASHKMQRISFQISNLASNGAGEIHVVVNSVSSNMLPFTVRSGSIYFVRTSGNDSTGNGSWSSSWRTIGKAVASLNAGDIAYINGVNQTIETEFSACVNLGSDGTASNPKALIVYPGSSSTVGNMSVERAFHVWNGDTSTYSLHWVLSGFDMITGGVGISGQSGFRVIGNHVTAPSGDGLDGAIGGIGNDVFILGNELENVGSLNSSKLYHAIYISGVRSDMAPREPTESNRHIAWNSIHDCLTNRAINVYSEQNFSAFITQHYIHDNVIRNQRGDGILLGYYVTGDNWIYNNLIVQAGLGPEWVDDASSHSGIRLDFGHDQSFANVRVYNNTLQACGYSGAAFTGESGHFLISTWALAHATAFDLRNNIVVSSGEPYIATDSGSPGSAAYKNSWYGDGAAPAWDTAALNSDPLFVNPAAFNFELQQSSPCRDTGNDVAPTVVRDLLGTPRPQQSAYDLGAYEFVSLDPDFVISCAPSSINVSTGSGKTSACTATSLNGYAGTVDLTCTGTPADVTCVPAPAQLVISAGGTAQSTVSVDAADNAIPGNYALSVQATDVVLNHSTGIALTISIPPVLLFSDNFEDDDALGWNFTKGTWTAVSGDLTGSTNRKADIFASFAGCVDCSVEAVLRVEPGAWASLLAWYIDKGHYVELLMKQSSNKWIFKQRSGGVVRKGKAILSIQPDMDYRVVITHGGGRFTVHIDGVQILDLAEGAAPAAGTVGFRVKSTAGALRTSAFEEILVY